MKHTQIYLSAFFIFLWSGHAESMPFYMKMAGKIFSNFLICSDEIEDKVTPALCISLFDPDSNTEDAQFNGCKEALTCALKKLEYMTEAGKFNEEKMSSLRDEIKDNDDIQEFDNTVKSCSSVEGTNGKAITNMASCILSSSTKAKQHFEELKDSFLGSYD